MLSVLGSLHLQLAVFRVSVYLYRNGLVLTCGTGPSVTGTGVSVFLCVCVCVCVCAEDFEWKCTYFVCCIHARMGWAETDLLAKRPSKQETVIKITPVNRFGLAVSRGTSVRIRFGWPFSSKPVVCGHCLIVTLSLTINDTLKCLSSLPILMQESFWWWQCSDTIIYLSPHPLLPVPNNPYGFCGR